MRHRFACIAAMLLVSATALPAQTPRPVLAPGNTVLIAAYDCAADQLARADALINELLPPVLNKYVSSGKVITWGYFGAYLGGHANRHVYLWAADPVALLQARQAYLPEIQTGPRFAEFAKICGSADVTVHNLIAIAGAPAK